MRRLRALVLAATIFAACGSDPEKGFGEGCVRSEECATGLSCLAVSTTVYASCTDPKRTVRFCSGPCKEHKDCDGLTAPNDAQKACVEGCSGQSMCSWVGPK